LAKPSGVIRFVRKWGVLSVGLTVVNYNSFGLVPHAPAWECIGI